MIILLQWDNVNGKEEKFDDCWQGRELFEKIRRLAGTEEEIIDVHYSVKCSLEEATANINRYLMACSGLEVDYPKVDYRVPIPNSEHMRLYNFDEGREFNQSAYKRMYVSEKTDLLTNGYPEWITRRIQEIGKITSSA